MAEGFINPLEQTERITTPQIPGSEEGFINPLKELEPPAIGEVEFQPEVPIPLEFQEGLEEGFIDPLKDTVEAHREQDPLTAPFASALRASKDIINASQLVGTAALDAIRGFTGSKRRETPLDFINEASAELVQKAIEGFGYAGVPILAGTAFLANVSKQLLGFKPGNEKVQKNIEREILFLFEISAALTLPASQARAFTPRALRRKLKSNRKTIENMDEVELADAAKVASNRIIDELAIGRVRPEAFKARMQIALAEADDAARLSIPDLNKLDVDEIAPSLFDPTFLNLNVMKAAVENAKVFLTSKGVDTAGMSPQTASAEIANLVATGKTNFGEIFTALNFSREARLRGEPIDPGQLAAWVYGTFSGAGRMLNQAKQFKDWMNAQVRAGEPGAKRFKEVFDGISEAARRDRQLSQGSRTFLDSESFIARYLRRGGRNAQLFTIMTFQTMAKNILGGSELMIYDNIARATERIGRRILGAPDRPDPLLPFLEFQNILLRPMTSKKTVKKLMNSQPELGSPDRIFNRVVADIEGHDFNPIAKMAVRFQQLHDTPFKAGIILADLERSLQGRGTTLKNIMEGRGKVHVEEMQRAIEQAYRQTYSLRADKDSPLLSNRVGGRITEVVKGLPGADAIAMFQNFNWGNWYRTLADYNMTGLMRLLNKDELSAFAKGNNDVFGRAFVGTTLLGGAYAIVKGQANQARAGSTPTSVIMTNDEGKETEVNFRGHIFGFHLALADFVLRSQEGRIDVSDTQFVKLWEGMAGRLPEGGLSVRAITESIRVITNTAMSGTDKLERLAGMITGNLTDAVMRPVTQISDFMSVFSDRFELVRERSALDLSQRLQAGTPGGGPNYFGLFDDIIPPRADPLTDKPRRFANAYLPFGIELPARVLRGFGISIDDPRGEAERALNFIGYPRRNVAPKTGNPSANFIIKTLQGPVADTLIPLIANSEIYQRMSVPRQRKVIFEAMKEVRAEALELFVEQSPEGALIRTLNNMPNVDKALINEVLAERDTSLGQINTILSHELREQIKTIVKTRENTLQ